MTRKSSQRGVEYAILASFIAAVIAGAVGSLGTTVAGLFQDFVDAFQAAIS